MKNLVRTTLALFAILAAAPAGAQDLSFDEARKDLPGPPAPGLRRPPVAQALREDAPAPLATVPVKQIDNRRRRQ